MLEGVDEWVEVVEPLDAASAILQLDGALEARTPVRGHPLASHR